MLLFWRIRYLDTRDKQFKDRDLWLETNELEAAIRAAVELCHQMQDAGCRRDMLRYRHLFHEKIHSEANLNQLVQRHGGMGSVFLHDYFEDESGEELSNRRMAAILTGRQDSVMFPAGTPQYMVDYVFAEKTPIPVDQISLSEGDLQALGYFTRDLREMQATAFFREKPGTLTSAGGNDPVLQTASTDEEIRSFVTIFRRLYMSKERANFVKSVALFEEALADHPLAKWVKGAAEEYEAELETPPHFLPMAGHTSVPFTCKRLIDVFIYTRYAHQPDERRTRQYGECLAAVGHKETVLIWLFLSELYFCGMRMWNAGKIIAGFVDRYCQSHTVSPEVLASITTDNPGIGGLEKDQTRRDRVFNEKAEELAKSIWEQNGRSAGGHMQYIDQAREQLEVAIGDRCSKKSEETQ